MEVRGKGGWGWEEGKVRGKEVGVGGEEKKGDEGGGR